jgi:hypothetical protein
MKTIPLSEMKAALKNGENAHTYALYNGGDDVLLLTLKGDRNEDFAHEPDAGGCGGGKSTACHQADHGR